MIQQGDATNDIFNDVAVYMEESAIGKLLRMIYDTYGVGAQAFMGYADRPNMDVAFGAPIELLGVPSVVDPVMTEDCSRIYFSGVSSLLWIQQL